MLHTRKDNGVKMKDELCIECGEEPRTVGDPPLFCEACAESTERVHNLSAEVRAEVADRLRRLEAGEPIPEHHASYDYNPAAYYHDGEPDKLHPDHADS